MKTDGPAGIWRGSCVTVLAAAAGLALPEGLPGEERSAPAGDLAALARSSGFSAGLCVHIGAGDGRRTAELGRLGRLVVHGLATGPAEAAKARLFIQSQGLYGTVSVDHWDRKAPLPYADSLVNWVICESGPASPAPVAEIVRVLCPNGVALIRGSAAGEVLAAGIKETEPVAGGWIRFRKPRPAEIDDWTHCITHGPDGNKVSQDAVSDASGVRWISAPAWPIGTRKGNLVGMAVAEGRFFLAGAGPRGSVDHFAGPGFLMVRDANNGLFLWERPVAWQLSKRTGRIVGMAAVGDRVYAPTRGGLVAYDAATGEVAFTHKADSPPCDVACAGGKAVVTLASRGLHALDARDGRPLWKNDSNAADAVIADGEVYFLEISRSSGPFDLVALNLATGKERLRLPLKELGGKTIPYNEHGSLRLCFQQKGVLLLGGFFDVKSDNGVMLHALAAKDGKHLWSYRYWPHGAALSGSLMHDRDVFFAQDLVWVSLFVNPECKPVNKGTASVLGLKPLVVGMDLATGEIRRQFEARPSQKCQAQVATRNYLMGAKHVEFIDLAAGRKLGGGNKDTIGFGGCHVGFRPGNGLVYSSPQECGCLSTAIRGLSGLGPGEKLEKVPPAEARLEKGPAYGMTDDRAGMTDRTGDSDEWPVFRHDAGRSGATATAVPPEAGLLWERKVEDQNLTRLLAEWGSTIPLTEPLTAPVVAGGKVFLALPFSHRVVALDAKSGQPAWQFTSGGMIDSPPTIHKGLCLFGCRDGWVYALKAGDGTLAWRFRAAPLDRRITVFGQVESKWPLFGSVVVRSDVAYAAAGRGTHADGGIFAYALDAGSGKLISQTRAEGGQKAGGFINEMLVADGEGVVLAGARSGAVFAAAPREKAGPRGLRGDQFATGPWRAYTSMAYRRINSWDYDGVGGALIAFDEKRVVALDMARYKHFHQFSQRPAKLVAFQNGAASGRKRAPLWTVDLPARKQAEALVLAGEDLFASVVSGPMDEAFRAEAYRAGGAEIWRLSAGDGRKLSELKLAVPPVYDGLAVACGRLYVSTADGRLSCFGAR